ncbi:MAG: DJ-1/PfpI family protein [Planctomycetota bacterium]
MAEKEAPEAGDDVDEYGLKVQKYVSTVLVVVPERSYAETTLRYARSSLYNVHVGTRSVSTKDEDLIHGEMQDEFQVDGRIEGETMDAYSGILLCGGEGALELVDHPDALRLVREADAAEKLIGAWGHSAALLARAGVVKGRKVTGDPSIAGALRDAGAKYTGVQVERDKHIVTAFDDAAGFRFGRELIRIVGI